MHYIRLCLSTCRYRLDRRRWPAYGEWMNVMRIGEMHVDVIIYVGLHAFHNALSYPASNGKWAPREAHSFDKGSPRR